MYTYVSTAFPRLITLKLQLSFKTNSIICPVHIAIILRGTLNLKKKKKKKKTVLTKFLLISRFVLAPMVYILFNGILTPVFPNYIYDFFSDLYLTNPSLIFKIP